MVGGKEVEGSMKMAVEEVKREGGGGSEVMGEKKKKPQHIGSILWNAPQKIKK